MSTPRKRVALFHALTFVLLGAVPILHGLMASGPMNFAAAGARAFAETGLAWTSNLLVMVRLCLAEPVLWLIVFGSAVPSIAALLVVARNRSALGSLLARLGPRIPWRRALMDYGLVFVLMIGGLVAVSMLRSFLPGPEYVRPENFVGPGLIVAVHGLGNDSVGISGAASMELALSPYHQATKALPFALLAVGIVLVAGKSLGLARQGAG